VVDPSTRSISSFFITPPMIWLFSCRFAIWSASCRFHQTSVRSDEPFAVLRLGPLFLFCLVASGLVFGPLSKFW
jgi:hypothetical protein